MKKIDPLYYEEMGLWRWLAEAWAEMALIPSMEERLKSIGVRFKVHKTPHGDLILFDKPNLRNVHQPEPFNID